MPEFIDADGRFGFADGRSDTTSLRLHEDGELVAQRPGFRGEFAVGSDPATYRAELDVSRRAAFARLATDTETAWTFRSAPTEEEEAVPLLPVDCDLGPLDLLNRAPHGQYEIDFRVRRQQGAPATAVASLDVRVSYDDGGTWRRVDVEGLGGGNFTAELAHPARATARHVALRVQAADAGGSRITQTIMQAYGLE